MNQRMPVNVLFQSWLLQDFFDGLAASASSLFLLRHRDQHLPVLPNEYRRPVDLISHYVLPILHCLLFAPLLLLMCVTLAAAICDDLHVGPQWPQMLTAALAGEPSDNCNGFASSSLN